MSQVAWDPREITSEALRVVVVGHWPVGPSGSRAGDELTEIHHCPDTRQVSGYLERTGADWLLIGRGYDDYAIDRLLSSVRLRRDCVRLAILGEAQEWRRAERWLRRGCDLYLQQAASLDRVIEAMRLVGRLDVSIIDSAFHQSLRKALCPPSPSLTRRERDVLELLTRGMRNWEIADHLHLSENTVESHVRHLLQKLGARNRIEAYRQAMIMGIS